MNKSDSGENKGTIFLMENIASARKKIMSAQTDSLARVHFDEENQPGISNLMSIYSKITHKTFDEIEKEFEGQGYGFFKGKVADAVCDLLSNIQQRYAKFSNRAYLDEILSKGAQKAREKASKTLDKAKIRLGLK